MDFPTTLRTTAEDFLRIIALPENVDRRLELIDGEIVEKPMPRPLHGYIAMMLAHLLRTFIETHPLGQVLVETQYAVPGEVYAPIPDVSFVHVDQPAIAWNEAVPFMPALAIEIQSPGQSDKDMSDKAQYYLKHGARMVWIVYPDRKLVEVLSATDRHLLMATDTLGGGDVLPGFSVEITRLFP